LAVGDSWRSACWPPDAVFFQCRPRCRLAFLCVPCWKHTHARWTSKEQASSRLLACSFAYPNRYNSARPALEGQGAAAEAAAPVRPAPPVLPHLLRLPPRAHALASAVGCPQTDPLLFAFVHAGCAHVSLVPRSSKLTAPNKRLPHCRPLPVPSALPSTPICPLPAPPTEAPPTSLIWPLSTATTSNRPLPSAPSTKLSSLVSCVLGIGECSYL
jgi:hypothetical protein